ncbi:hypothetical protein MSG28_015111 [Choristoneura fumiferana]|uniref:Uncharacterized protein n=1 Tax=Choristoneura fumiferana TaxID=7141 RepID=A0ACC0KYJ1_CHOFU|nr:hypothetical protein MSG28_015111 [Choristoneura fumiferana]
MAGRYSMDECRAGCWRGGCGAGAVRVGRAGARVETKDGRIAGQRPAKLYEISLQAASDRGQWLWSPYKLSRLTEPASVQGAAGNARPARAARRSVPSNTPPPGAARATTSSSRQPSSPAPGAPASISVACRTSASASRAHCPWTSSSLFICDTINCAASSASLLLACRAGIVQPSVSMVNRSAACGRGGRAGRAGGPPPSNTSSGPLLMDSSRKLPPNTTATRKRYRKRTGFARACSWAILETIILRLEGFKGAPRLVLLVLLKEIVGKYRENTEHLYEVEETSIGTPPRFCVQAVLYSGTVKDLSVTIATTLLLKSRGKLVPRVESPVHKAMISLTTTECFVRECLRLVSLKRRRQRVGTVNSCGATHIKMPPVALLAPLLRPAPWAVAPPRPTLKPLLTWVIQAEAILIRHKLWKFIENPVNADSSTTDKEGDRQASTGLARKEPLLKQLILTKLEGNDVITHLNIFMDNVDKLADMDININEDLLTIIMLYSLPSEYENIRIAIKTRDKLPSPGELKTKTIEESEARHNRNSTSNDEPESSHQEEALYCLLAQKGKSKKPEWVLDSGCTSHISNQRDMFKNIESLSRKLNFSTEEHTSHLRYCDAIRCEAMRCDAMRCDAKRCDAKRCDAKRCEAMRSDASDASDARRCDGERCEAMRSDANDACDAKRCEAMRCERSDAMDGWGWMNGWMDGWMDGWMKYFLTCLEKHYTSLGPPELVPYFVASGNYTVPRDICGRACEGKAINRTRHPLTEAARVKAAARYKHRPFAARHGCQIRVFPSNLGSVPYGYQMKGSKIESSHEKKSNPMSLPSQKQMDKYFEELVTLRSARALFVTTGDGRGPAHDPRPRPRSPIYVPLLGTLLLSEQEGLGHSSYMGPVRIENFTRTIDCFADTELKP